MVGQHFTAAWIAETDHNPGDEFNVIIDTSLYPPGSFPPAEYPPATLKEVDHPGPCMVEDIAEWIVDYINSDILVGFFF